MGFLEIMDEAGQDVVFFGVAPRGNSEDVLVLGFRTARPQDTQKEEDHQRF
jgi:hypothetical protein